MVAYSLGVIALSLFLGPLILIFGAIGLPVAWRLSRPQDPDDPSRYPTIRR